MGPSGLTFETATKVSRLLGFPSFTLSTAMAVITKVKGKPRRFTQTEPVVNLLKKFNIKMLVEDPKLINLYSTLVGKSI